MNYQHKHNIAIARASLCAYGHLVYHDFCTPDHIVYIASRLEALARREIKRLMIICPPRHGKQVAHDTPVITPNGYKKHGDLRVDDYVYGLDGKPKRVEALSEDTVSDYCIEFSDGEKIWCHGNHEWIVKDRRCRKIKIINTKSLAIEELSCEGVLGKRGHRYRFQVDGCPTLEMGYRPLMIDPYLLGVWLGDGTSSTGTISNDEQDRVIIDRIKGKGGIISSSWQHKTTGVWYYYVKYLRGSLGRLKILRNKHIPKDYLLSSMSQRLELLAGLVDTDGHMDKGGRYRVSTCSKALVSGMVELVRSLGGNPYVMKAEPVKSSSGIDGRQVVYQVGFNLPHALPVALMRKSNANIRYVRRKRAIVKVEKSGEGKTGRCIQVEGGIYLVGRTHIPTHNSYLVSTLFPAWYLGHNPKHGIIHTSCTTTLSNEFSRRVRDIVAVNEGHRMVYDVDTRKDSRDVSLWHTQHGGHFLSSGIQSTITGFGANCFIIDDPVKDEIEADSELTQDRIYDAYRQVLYSRLEPDAVVALIMTRWHKQDLGGRILDSEGAKNWEIIHLKALTDTGQALWPERYPVKVLEEIRSVVGERAWFAMYQGEPTSPSAQIIKPHMIRYYDVTPQNTLRYGGVDIASQTKEINDNTAVVSVRKDADNNIYVEECMCDKLMVGETSQYVISQHRKSKYESIRLESNNAGEAVRQAIMECGLREGVLLPLNPVASTTDKIARLKGVQYMFETGRVYFKSGMPEIESLIRRLLDFHQSRIKDDVDALVFAIQEAVRDSRNVDTDAEETREMYMYMRNTQVTRFLPTSRKEKFEHLRRNESDRIRRWEQPV